MNDELLIDASCSAQRVELRYRKRVDLQAEVVRLTAAENQCCDVEGIVFSFEEHSGHYSVYVVAPEDACRSAAVNAVLDNFAGMPQRPKGPV